VLKEGTFNHIQSAAGLGTWHAFRTFLSSVLTEDDICNSSDKGVIINYDDNDKAHEECTGDDEVQYHETSALDGAGCSTSRPGRFTSGKKSWYH
jgi:hypothetical protein